MPTTTDYGRLPEVASGFSTRSSKSQRSRQALTPSSWHGEEASRTCVRSTEGADSLRQPCLGRRRACGPPPATSIAHSREAGPRRAGGRGATPGVHKCPGVAGAQRLNGAQELLEISDAMAPVMGSGLRFPTRQVLERTFLREVVARSPAALGEADGAMRQASGGSPRDETWRRSELNLVWIRRRACTRGGRGAGDTNAAGWSGPRPWSLREAGQEDGDNAGPTHSSVS